MKELIVANNILTTISKHHSDREKCERSLYWIHSLEQPIGPERLRRRTQGYPSTTLYMVFWRSGTDSMELDSPANQQKREKLPKMERDQRKRQFSSWVGIRDCSQRRDEKRDEDGTGEAEGKVKCEEEEVEEREKGWRHGKTKP